MQRSITARLISMWQARPSLRNTYWGMRQATARPTPMAIFCQCSVRQAASISSCKRKLSRCVFARPGVALGAGMGCAVAGEPPALVAIALATLFFGMMLLPPRFRPMDSRKSCMQMTMPMSSVKIPVENSHSPTVQPQASSALTYLWVKKPLLGLGASSASGGGVARGMGTNSPSRPSLASLRPSSETGDASRCWSRTPSMRWSSSLTRPRDARTRSRSSRPMTTAPFAAGSIPSRCAGLT
mmetsp:Transcript_128774/g.364208  ORF Transcript_128774/g.364208 Transcript_128774/m.364208 type:complete len:241 (+) Transcript_128774:396-1118(+)